MGKVPHGKVLHGKKVLRGMVRRGKVLVARKGDGIVQSVCLLQRCCTPQAQSANPLPEMLYLIP